MPEGDTIYRTATVLRRVLLGHCLTGFETTVRQVAMVCARRPGTAMPHERREVPPDSGRTTLSPRLFAGSNNRRSKAKMGWTAVHCPIYGYCTNDLNAKHFA
jgi:hypothetical protein